MSNRCEAIPAGCDLSAPEPESLQGPAEHIRAEHRLGRVRDPRQRALLRWRCGTNGAGILPPTSGSFEVEEQNHRVLQLHNGGAVRYAATRAAVRGGLFRTSLTSGKGNKADTLRLRSDDTGHASWLGSALHAERWGVARAERT